MSCYFEAENAFGPAVNPCRRTFDFTLLFEEIFFRLIPACIFLVAVAIRLYLLYQRPVEVRTSRLHFLKLSVTIALAILDLVNLVLICVRRNRQTRISVPAVVLSYVASVALIILSHLEHVRSRRPSFVISFYICITLLLRSATARTYWLLDPGGALPSITLAIVSLYLILIVLESLTKKSSLIRKDPEISAEESVGFISRSLFLWLNKLMITGYRRPIASLDLQMIDTSLLSPRVVLQFEHLLDANFYGRFGLLVQTLRCLGLYAFVPVLPRLCLTGFTFAQPFLASSLISYLENPEEATENQGYGLIGASFLVYTGVAISTGWYWQLSYKGVTKIRSGLINTILSKMQKLRQENGVEAKILTLMISDVQRITSALAYMHEVWAVPLETGMGTWLLLRQVGPSSLTVLGIVLLCAIASGIIGKHAAAQQEVWYRATENRIAATRNMLASLKAIKMMGIGNKFGQTIEKLRALEFAKSSKFRSLIVGSLFCSYSTLTLAPVVVFAAYIAATAAEQQQFNSSRVFSSLILISLLASPLVRLLQMIPSLGAAIGCFSRLQDFLQKAERIDDRIFCPQLKTKQEGRVSVEEKLQDNPLGPKHCDGLGYNPMVSIREAHIGWEGKAQLKDVSLEVMRGEHIVITGVVGSGKSLLLHTILGEVTPLAGTISISSARIAYCSQTPWLENLTAHNNAFRWAQYNEELWRGQVIDACALQGILDSQVMGDTIGSGGAQISGGERQRLALARAIASRPALLLLDDAFSAIDRKTKKYMLNRLFGVNGVLKEQETTVIQISQDQSVMQFADRIFCINESGNLVQVKSSEAGLADKEENPVPECISRTHALLGNERSPVNKGFANPSGISDREVYRTYFQSIGRTHMIIFIICGILFGFTLKFPDVWAQWWSNASSGNSGKSTDYWIGIYALLNVLPLLVISIWIAHLMHRIVPRSGFKLHTKLLKTVLNASFVFINGVETGSIMNRFNQDLMLIDTLLPLDLLNTAAELFTCIAQVILVCVATLYVLAVLPALCIVAFLVQHFYLRTSKQLRQWDLESKSILHTRLSESYAGLVTIRAHGWESNTRREFQHVLDRSQEPLYLLYMVQTWLRLVLSFVVVGLSVIVTSVAVATRHTTSASAMGVALLNLTSLGETMATLLASWTSLETSLGAIARIKAFEDDTPVEDDVPSAVSVPPGWPKFGQLELKNVWASYDSTSDPVNMAWTLRDISINICAGEKVAICGRTGSGKSTLLLTLLGLIKTTKGEIWLDGINISCVPQSFLRSRFNIISQDTFIHGVTIQSALDAENNFSVDKVNEVLRDCGILEKVTAIGGLSGHLDKANFSAGEAQLFSLARTVLDAEAKQGGVVLLDEATSSIDADTEQRIMRLITKRLSGKTIISILHRLEAALEYDRIIVLEQGEVVGFGSPAEVMRSSDLFSSLKQSA